MAANFLYSLRDTIHRDVELFSKMWKDAPHLDAASFRTGLARMPICCDGKWVHELLIFSEQAIVAIACCMYNVHVYI